MTEGGPMPPSRASCCASCGRQPSGKPRSVWEFVGPRLQGSRAALAFVAITAAVTAVVGIINPALSQVFMDRLLGGKNPEWLYPFIALLIAVGAVRIVVEVLNAMYLLRLEGKMAVVSNSSFMWKVLHLPMEFFSQRMAGDLSACGPYNTTTAASLVKQLAPLLLNCAAGAVRRGDGCLQPLLAAIGIASVVINLGMARLISAKRVNVTRVQMRDAGKLAAATVSGIEMVETIKAAGAEGGYFERWAGFQAGFNTQQVRFARLGQRLGLVPQLVMQVTNTAVLMTGVYLVLQGQFTVGMILAFKATCRSPRPASR
ncbi:MAG: ABC transporter transmembrane domain-containing protein [Eggerthellaceae bacterium]